ncbi:MAG: hypothetical protein IH582_11955 [Afipia sp.]|jgi:hypothetical protein|nr:hypothetical protein [Afipia sp.]
MSSVNKDRKIQANSGKAVPDDDAGRRLGAAGFAAAISEALHREFDGNGSAVKAIVGLTSANERAVKNWYQGKNGPSGEFLVLLCRHSDQVLEAVLVLAGREDLVNAKKLVDAKGKLREILSLIDEIESGPGRSY